MLARMAQEITSSIDIMVNSAGIYPFVTTAETPEDVFDSVYAVNVKIPSSSWPSWRRKMAERGSGVIVNVPTSASIEGPVGATAYMSSKAADNQQTRIWAAEYRPAGVRVSAVRPGITETERLQAAFGVDQSAFPPSRPPATPVDRKR